MRLLLLLLATALVARTTHAAHVPLAYPLFKQCDDKWGLHHIGTADNTICKVGCIMSCTAMALNAHNVTIAGTSATPLSLNNWLTANDGYVNGDDLEEAAVSRIAAPGRVVWPKDASVSWTHGRQRTVSLAAVQAMLLQGRVIIANVRKGRHFVLLVGWDDSNPDVLFVNDPGFNRTTYSFNDDVVGLRIYDMKNGAAKAVASKHSHKLDADTAAVLNEAPKKAATVVSKFPRHWGAAPRMQTRDYVQLPAEYGFGSGTLRRWIQSHIDGDKAAVSNDAKKKAAVASPTCVPSGQPCLICTTCPPCCSKTCSLGGVCL
jgi:hypothetical protein